jgi:hypothetical protein
MLPGNLKATGRWQIGAVPHAVLFVKVLLQFRIRQNSTFSGYNQPVSIQLPQEALDINHPECTSPSLWIAISIGIGVVVVFVMRLAVIRHRMTKGRS